MKTHLEKTLTLVYNYPELEKLKSPRINSSNKINKKGTLDFVYQSS